MPIRREDQPKAGEAVSEDRTGKLRFARANAAALTVLRPPWYHVIRSGYTPSPLHPPRVEAWHVMPLRLPLGRIS